VSTPRQILELLAGELQVQFAPLRIILFGAHAHEADAGEAEVEMLVILHDDESPNYRRAGEIRKFYEKRIPLQLMIGTVSQIAHRLDDGDDAVKEILDRGEVLFADPSCPGTPEQAVRRLAEP
jgi:hypothetical protein